MSVPFTPRASSSAQPPTSIRYRANGAKLTTKDESKISHTLASVRKSRPTTTLSSQLEEAADEDDDDHRMPPPPPPPSQPAFLRPSSKLSGQLAAAASSSRRTDEGRGGERGIGRSGAARRSETTRDVAGLGGGRERRDKEEAAGRREARETAVLLPSASAADQSFAVLPEQSFHSRPLSSRIPPPTSRYSPTKSPSNPNARPLDSYLLDAPLEIQEAMALRDLLFILMGIEGTIITFRPGYDPLEEDQRMKGAEFDLDPGLDPGLSSVLRRILPLASYAMGIEAFIDSRCDFQYGKVNHALGSGLREMLQDYSILLTQLETLFLTSSAFTLQKAFFYLHPTIHTLSLLHQLTYALYLADDSIVDDQAGDGEIEEEDESSEDEMAAALGLGGKKMKELMKQMNGGGDRGGDEGGGGLVVGGEVLSLIWNMRRGMSGDPKAYELYTRLLLHASQPYAEMLVDWISSGHLTDKYDEFLVREATSISKKALESDFTDEYWERRYTLRDGSTFTQSIKGKAPTRAGVPAPRRGTAGTPEARLPGGACIPRFLEPWKHKILLAGKYLNVIRECGVEVEREDDEELGLMLLGKGGMIDLEDEKFHRRIESAYIHANQTLLKMLIEEQDLVSHLRSLKYHFFLSQSSFLTHFLDLSLSELAKSARSASLVKLQSLLELTLRTSAGSPLAEGELKDDVRVVMASEKLYEFLGKIINQKGPFGAGAGGGDDEDGENNGNGGSMGAASGRTSRAEEAAKKDLIAIEAFQLDYTVKFPLSLVISRKTIARYQILFRFLLQLKHAELRLSLQWTDHTTDDWRSRTDRRPRAPTPTPSTLGSGRPSSRLSTARAGGAAPPSSSAPLPDPDSPLQDWSGFEKWKLRVWTLRARMLAFVQQMMAFVCLEVLEPNWRSLEEKLRKVTTVDQMLGDHVEFLDTCLKEAALTKGELIEITAKLISLIQNWCIHSKVLNAFARTATLAHQAGEADAKVDERNDWLVRWEKNFDHNLGVQIERVTFFSGSDNTALLPLVVRLESLRR